MTILSHLQERVRDVTSLLSTSQACGVLASTSVFVYSIFKRFEPEKPLYLALLLVVIPSFLVPVLLPHFTDLPCALLSTFSIYYALILLLVATYRLSPFHPLAKYPGPIRNKLSKFWMAYVTTKGRQHKYYQQLHERYGDVVRVGPNEISICNVDAIQPVLGAMGLPKGPAWDNRHPVGESRPLVEERDPAEHQKRRRPWNRAFSSSSLKNYEPMVLDRCRELVAQLAMRQGEVVDVVTWMRSLAFDVMGSMVFDTDFGFTKSGGDKEGIWSVFEMGLRAGAVLSHIPWAIPTLRFIHPNDTLSEKMVALAVKWVGERIQRGSTRKDLFYHLMDEDHTQSERPSMDDVTSEGTLAVIGGSDTTSTTISVIIYYLLQSPSQLQQLRAEIDQNFTRDEEPLDFARMTAMPYLNGCINEALRLFPPIMSGSQRGAPKGSGGKMVGPCFIPESNNVLVQTACVQRDSRYFSDSNSFLPERWLAEKHRTSLTKGPFVHDASAFIPFSFGPANCAGRGMALMEMRAAVCFIVQRFDFRVKDGFEFEKWKDGIEDWIVVMLPSLPVVFDARK